MLLGAFAFAITEELFGREAALEAVARALEGVQLHLHFALALRGVGLVHFERRLRLIDLLADLAVLDLRDNLAS